MKVLRSSAPWRSIGFAFAIALTVAVPIVSAFTAPTPHLAGAKFMETTKHYYSNAATSFHQSSSKQRKKQGQQQKRRRRTTPLASRQREEDLEDKLWSIRNSWKLSQAEQNKNKGAATTVLVKEFKDRFLKLPPPPEDQFIMTGDIAMLFLYAFTSHSINDSVVKGLLENPKMTVPEAIKELDPMHEVVKNLQPPVWVDLASNPNVPFGNPSVDHALEVTAREAFLNHWGPLLSTEGSACVALCTCWLLAGWFHRAFLFDNSTYCSADHALFKTAQTWLTAALLLACLATGTDWLVGHVVPPEQLQSLFFCVTCSKTTSPLAEAASVDFYAAMAATATPGGIIGSTIRSGLPSSVSVLSLTQSDVVFIVDSLTILLAWRWSAHRVLNIFR